MIRDVNWDRLWHGESRWELRSFTYRDPPTWEAYWLDQRKYWGADEPDQRRIRLYFGDVDTEESFLSRTQKGYADLKEHMLHWNGLCKVGQIVYVELLEPNVLGLSKRPSSDSSYPDMEIWLKEELAFFVKHIRYCAEVYTFGTLTVFPGSLEAQMGERVGSTRVSWRQGLSPDKNETVARVSISDLRVGDAVFRAVE